MGRITGFFEDIDASWKPKEQVRIPLHVIGSAALMLQTGYNRGTKDSDIIETQELTSEVQRRLTELAGKGSPLSKSHLIYLDIVHKGLPFLPQPQNYVPLAELNSRLTNFNIFVLDVTDVIVSKLKRFNSADREDILAMIQEERVKHEDLVERFKQAVDAFEMDARMDDARNRYLKNLHTVERDYFQAPESDIDIPDWG